MNSRNIVAMAIFGVLAFQSCTSSKPDKSDLLLPSGTSAQTVLQSIRPGDLIRAAAIGDETKVRLLLQSGANVHETMTVSVPAHEYTPAHQETLTPLLAAVAMDFDRVAAILINHQAKSAAAFQPKFQGYTAKDFLLYRGQNSTASLLR